MPPQSMPGDSPARFLAELRALRDHVGIGYAELAARAHYPTELMIAADAGPSLPDLPVLSAYVRGCGGVPAEWEDRWRALTGSFGEPGLPTRPLGGSAASEAGARAGATAAVPEDHDPAQIMAVLSRAASAEDATQLNGHWRHSAPDADAALSDAAPSVLPSPVPVPSSPPPVPSAPMRPPFEAPARPAGPSYPGAPAHPGASRTDPGETRGSGTFGRHAAVLLDRARDGRDRSPLTPATLTLILVVVLILAGILLAIVL